MSSNESKHTFGEAGAYMPVLFALPIVLLAIGGIWALRARPQMMASLEKGEADGRAFAVTKKTASECVDGAMTAMDGYGEPREPGAAAFLESCLKTSGLPLTSGGNKHSAPTRGQLEAWSRDECAARGRAGDKHCVLLVQLANLDPCAASFVGQNRATPPWSCP